MTIGVARTTPRSQTGLDLGVPITLIIEDKFTRKWQKCELAWYNAGMKKRVKLWAFDTEAMDRFTLCYTTLRPQVDTTDLPYWDLAAALKPAGNLADWGLPPAKELRFRDLHHHFVIQALHRLASR